MMRNDIDATTLEERYISAGNSSNLRCETREDAPLGDTAVLIAAGWSPSRIGALLMRLHTKPDRIGLEQAHQQIAIQAERWGFERPTAVAASVLAWWLNRACKACRGVRLEAIAGTPSLSSRQCRSCGGTGQAKLAYGDNGKQLLEWLENCKDHAAASIKKRLQAIK